jgi:c-di-GMP-binding flagellar brake protein YcgR
LSHHTKDRRKLDRRKPDLKVDDLKIDNRRKVCRRKDQPRRAHERYAVKDHWNVSLDALYSGDVGNLSLNGVFVRSEKLIPVNSVIKIDFSPPGKTGGKVSIDAKVVWTRKDRHGKSVGMGVEFLNHPRTDDKIIEYYIDLIRKHKDERA